MSIPPITPLPPAPSISDPTNFEAEADALLGAMPTMVTQMNAAFDVVDELVASAGFTGTSTTSLAIGTGSKSLTVETGRSFVVGMNLLIADTAGPTTNWMAGQVTTYDTGTGALVVSVPVGATKGSGTIAAWTVSLTGPMQSKASVAEILAGTDDTKHVTPKGLYDAAALTALTDAATVAVDLATGFNFKLTIGGNRTLGAPTNAKEGGSGVIQITQDGTGSRTLAYNTAWKFAGGAPTLSTAAGAVDLISYIVVVAGGSPILRCNIAKAFS